jgi:hypothetical protein
MTGPELFVQVAARLDRSGVVWWLSNGTALGCWREDRLLPWDSDIDLGCWHTDLPAVKAALDGLLTFTRDRPEHLMGRSGDVKVDVHGHRADGGRVSYELLKGKLRFEFSADLFDEFETVTFYGREVRVPSPCDRYLTEAYGPGWETPRRRWNFRQSPPARRS